MSERTFLTLNRQSSKPTVLLVEHAGSLIPEDLARLGLGGDVYKQDPQMFYDGHAKQLAEGLAMQLGLTAIFGINSRLVVDLNREADHPNVIPAIAHGRTIPKNQHLTDATKAKRLECYYKPFHDEVGAILQERQADGVPFNLVSIHSFSPAEVVRAFSDQPMLPVDIAALYDEESALSGYFRNTIKPDPYIYRENYPYDLRQLRTGSILACKRRFGCDAIGLELNVDTLAQPEAFNGLRDILIGVLQPLQSQALKIAKTYPELKPI